MQWPATSRTIDGRVTFSCSTEGAHFSALGDGFVARPGRWVGARVGLFAQAPDGMPSVVAMHNGWAEFGFFRVTQ